MERPRSASLSSSGSSVSQNSTGLADSLSLDATTQRCSVCECSNASSFTNDKCGCKLCETHLLESLRSLSSSGCTACTSHHHLQTNAGFDIEFFDDMPTPVGPVFPPSVQSSQPAPVVPETVSETVSLPSSRASSRRSSVVDLAMPTGADSRPSTPARLSLARGSPRWHDPRAPSCDPQEPYQLERGAWPVLKIENVRLCNSY